MSYADDIHPDETRRAERREALLTRLGAYFDAGFVESARGGWPVVSEDDFQELYSIFGEIIDLKFSRDGDGDRGIEYAMVDRRRARMHVFRERYSPETAKDLDDDTPVTEDERLVYAESMLRLGAHMAGTAERITGSAHDELRTLMDLRTAERELLAKVDALRARIDAKEPFDDVREELRSLYRSHYWHRDVKNLLQHFRTQYRWVFGAAEDEAIAALEAAEAAGGYGLEDVRQLIVQGIKTYGSFGFLAAKSRFNKGVETRRQAVTAAGGRPTEEYIYDAGD